MRALSLDPYILLRYNNVIVPTRSEVKEMHKTLGSWDAVGNALGINKAVAWRYANEDNWEPVRSDLRKALGLPDITYIRQFRNEEGRFT